MSRISKLFLLLFLSLFICCSDIAVFATDDLQYYSDENGNTFTEINGVIYQLIDGNLYRYSDTNSSIKADTNSSIEADTSSDTDSDMDSITDVMGGFSKKNTPDSEVMSEVTEATSSTIGLALSIIIYVIFASQFVVTAFDLLYIGVPFVRSFLYNPNSYSAHGSATANLESAVGYRPSYASALENKFANQAAQRADMHAQKAQIYANAGNVRQANYEMGRAQQNTVWANEWATKSQQSQARLNNDIDNINANRAARNQQSINSAQNRANERAEYNARMNNGGNN